MSPSRTRVRSVSVRGRTPLAHVPEKKRGAQPLPLALPAPQDDAVKQLGFGERMLRNTAVCVALLLTVLALASVQSPAASGITGFLSRVVSMDLSESLGSLKFVSNLIPESVQVLWNLGAERHTMPSGAEVVHVFSASEPWLGYAAGEAMASAAGEVMSLAVDAAGHTTVRVRHASGMESLYGNLLRVSVREGDWVEAGDPIGAAKNLTYELRGEGRPMDPAPYLR